MIPSVFLDSDVSLEPGSLFIFLLAVLLSDIPGECAKALQIQFVIIIIIIRLSYQEMIN